MMLFTVVCFDDLKIVEFFQEAKADHQLACQRFAVKKDDLAERSKSRSKHKLAIYVGKAPYLGNFGFQCCLLV